MKAVHLQTGARGEDLAVAELERRGYVVLARNYRSGRWGELDIVAMDGQVVVFVEVKTRGSTSFGGAVGAVSPAKLQKLRRAADHFLLTKNLQQHPCRFDVVAIQTSGSGAALEHFINVTG